MKLSIENCDIPIVKFTEFLIEYGYTLAFVKGDIEIVRVEDVVKREEVK